MASIIEQVPKADREAFDRLGYTMVGMMVRATASTTKSPSMAQADSTLGSRIAST